MIISETSYDYLRTRLGQMGLYKQVEFNSQRCYWILKVCAPWKVFNYDYYIIKIIIKCFMVPLLSDRVKFLNI